MINSIQLIIIIIDNVIIKKFDFYATIINNIYQRIFSFVLRLSITLIVKICINHLKLLNLL